RLRNAFDLYEVPRTYPETIATKPLRALYRSRTRTRLLVLDKENGGKADSLNAAINASRFPLVIAVDADTLIEPDALLRLTRPVPQGIPPRDRRVPHGERGRGPRSRRAPAPLSAAAQATLRNSLHSRSGGVDRGPRVRADPVTSAGAVAPRPDRRDVAVQGHALQPPVRPRGIDCDALFRVR